MSDVLIRPISKGDKVKTKDGVEGVIVRYMSNTEIYLEVEGKKEHKQIAKEDVAMVLSTNNLKKPSLIPTRKSIFDECAQRGAIDIVKTEGKDEWTWESDGLLERVNNTFPETGADYIIEKDIEMEKPGAMLIDGRFKRYTWIISRRNMLDIKHRTGARRKGSGEKNYELFEKVLDKLKDGPITTSEQFHEALRLSRAEMFELC